MTGFVARIVEWWNKRRDIDASLAASVERYIEQTLEPELGADSDAGADVHARVYEHVAEAPSYSARPRPMEDVGEDAGASADEDWGMPAGSAAAPAPVDATEPTREVDSEAAGPAFPLPMSPQMAARRRHKACKEAAQEDAVAADAVALEEDVDSETAAQGTAIAGDEADVLVNESASYAPEDDYDFPLPPGAFEPQAPSSANASYGASYSAPAAAPPLQSAPASAPASYGAPTAAPPLQSAPAGAAAPLEDMLRNLDASFSSTLLQMIDARGLKDSQVYRRANLTRQHFSKIRSNDSYRPTKNTVLALAIALQLSLNETKLLLDRAGFSLSHASKQDVIVEYFLNRGEYDLNTINRTLYHFDQPVLGS